MHVCMTHMYVSMSMSFCMLHVRSTGLPHGQLRFRSDKNCTKRPGIRRQVTDSGENPEIGGFWFERRRLSTQRKNSKRVLFNRGQSPARLKFAV